MKEGYIVEPCKEATQDPKTAAATEPREEQPKLRRFRIVKLEERIAPVGGAAPSSPRSWFLASDVSKAALRAARRGAAT